MKTSAKTYLFDNHGRPLNYLRLAVTDRCNLRCLYCLPEGVKFAPKKDLLTLNELKRLVDIFIDLGIDKIRITGGEPFVRKDLMPFLKFLNAKEQITNLSITTNGVLTRPHVAEFTEMGIKSVNLSLDTLDRKRFEQITNRDKLPDVLDTLHELLSHDIRLKINTVVMDGRNIQDIIPLCEFTREHPVNVRFIEEMPFNGTESYHSTLIWTYEKILDHIKNEFGPLTKLDDSAHSTSQNFQIPGFKGTVGVIPAFSRTFCGSCNRIRLTALGMLKTCLYDDGVFNIKEVLRSDKSIEYLKIRLLKAFANRPKNGFEAEEKRTTERIISESMSTIGG